MSEVHCDNFVKNVVNLLDTIKDVLDEARDKKECNIATGSIDIIVGYLEKSDKRHTIEAFIGHSIHKYWNEILKKNEKFLHDNYEDFFSSFNFEQESADTFGKMLNAINKKKEYIVPRDTVWEYLYSIVKCCIKYIFVEMGPIVSDLGGYEFSKQYDADLPDMDKEIIGIAKTWRVDLSRECK